MHLLLPSHPDNATHPNLGPATLLKPLLVTCKVAKGRGHCPPLSCGTGLLVTVPSVWMISWLLYPPFSLFPFSFFREHPPHPSLHVHPPERLMRDPVTATSSLQDPGARATRPGFLSPAWCSQPGLHLAQSCPLSLGVVWTTSYYCTLGTGATTRVHMEPRMGLPLLPPSRTMQLRKCSPAAILC